MNYEHNNLSLNSNNIIKDIRSDLEPIKDGLSIKHIHTLDNYYEGVTSSSHVQSM